jgi:sensor histidine kinase regulating citrate/malate metabolism
MANNDFSKTTEQRKENLRKILTPIIAVAVTVIGCAIVGITINEYPNTNNMLFYCLIGCSAVVFSIIFLLISTILLIRKIDLDNTGKYRTVIYYLHIAIFNLCIIGLFAVILSSIYWEISN